jgi:diaminopimelate epimerase
MTQGPVCYRLSGGGNDFLALVEPAEAPDGHRIRAWCRRGVSLGADGLFVLRREGDGVRMDYYNADGRRADLCLNGTRCAVRLADHLGWSSGRVAIDTGAGRIWGQADDSSALGARAVRLELAPPTEPPRRRTVEIEGHPWEGWYAVVGVPQFVIEWPGSLAGAPLAELGPPLRRHPGFGAAGTNVMFVRFLSPDRLEIRSYERGVEAETLACGTGVLAAAAVALCEGSLRAPIRALTAGGFEFVVDGKVDARGRVESWTLTGDARLLARLELEPGADVAPPPASWT